MEKCLDFLQKSNMPFKEALIAIRWLNQAFPGKSFYDPKSEVSPLIYFLFHYVCFNLLLYIAEHGRGDLNLSTKRHHPGTNPQRFVSISKQVIDLETGQRGFVITGKDEFLEPYNEAKIELNKTISSLKEHLRQIPEHLSQLTLIESMISEWIETAGIPEIEARRLVTSSAEDLKLINETVLSGSDKKILEEIRT